MAEGVSVHLGPQHGQFLFDLRQFILQTEDDLSGFNRSGVVIMPPVLTHEREVPTALYQVCAGLV